MSINYETTSAVTLHLEILKLSSSVIGLELGVWTGHNMGHLLESCSNIKMLYGVDPYLPYQDWNRYIDEHVMNNAKNTAINNIAPFKDKSELIVAKSEDVAPKFSDGYLDFIFIDGDHSYEMCYKDLNLWYDKVKAGGLFSGHDFTLPGVNSALLKFRLEKNIKGNFKVIPNDVWFWIKD